MESDGEWRLAPAYDLVFAEGPGREHTMDVAGEASRPGDRDMLRVAEACGVDPGRARSIIAEVREAVAQWPRFADEAGVPAERAREIRRIIAARTG